MENRILISIIVPIYNTATYLEKCLSSICNQTFDEIEIIIVNDGSTDNSLELIYNFAKKDDRITVINQENQGLSGARNSGLNVASGDFVLFLDGDDWIDFDCCEKALVIAEMAQADVVMWSYTREYSGYSKPTLLFDNLSIQWDETNIDTLYRKVVGLTGAELREPQKIDSLVTVWGKLYKRQVLKHISFVNTKLIGTEDALFNIQVFRNVKRAVYIPDTLSHYRKDNMNSLTHLYKRQLVIQWKELYRRIKIQLDENHAPEEFYHALSNRICLGLIGIGLNLAEDNSMSFGEKRKELKKILGQSHYRKSLDNLEIQFLPIKWKVFFLCARYQCITGFGILLYIMNYLRGK